MTREQIGAIKKYAGRFNGPGARVPLDSSEVIALCDLALAALSAEGMVLVPKEPTEEMLAAMTRPNYSYQERYAALLRAAQGGGRDV